MVSRKVYLGGRGPLVKSILQCCVDGTKWSSGAKTETKFVDNMELILPNLE